MALLIRSFVVMKHKLTPAIIRSRGTSTLCRHITRSKWDRQKLFHTSKRFQTSEVKNSKSNKSVNINKATSEIRRLFSLAKPERWKLGGKFCAFINLI